MLIVVKLKTFPTLQRIKSKPNLFKLLPQVVSDREKPHETTTTPETQPPSIICLNPLQPLICATCHSFSSLRNCLHLLFLLLLCFFCISLWLISWTTCGALPTSPPRYSSQSPLHRTTFPDLGHSPASWFHTRRFCARC